ncbi:MAG: hypothetical protein GY856_36895 [bacterium]|nr:hypothetical protein [bacterium]
MSLTNTEHPGDFSSSSGESCEEAGGGGGVSCVALAPLLAITDWSTHFDLILGFAVAFVALWAATKEVRRG